MGLTSEYLCDFFQASINLSLVYGGDQKGMEKYAAPFRAIGLAVQEQQFLNLEYPNVFNSTGSDESSAPTCATGWYRQMHPSYYNKHNITALRQAHTIFTNTTSRFPDTMQRSIYVIEQYPLQAVRAVPYDRTAVAHARDQRILS